MALSEQEQELLASMEARLAAEDPGFGVRLAPGPAGEPHAVRQSKRAGIALLAVGMCGILTVAWSLPLATVGAFTAIGGVLLLARTAKRAGWSVERLRERRALGAAGPGR